MAFSSTFDHATHATAANRPDRLIELTGGLIGAASERYRNWRRAETDRADLRHVDPKDLGYASELSETAGIAAPGALARFALTGFALLVGELAFALLQQSLLTGLHS